MLQCNYSQKDGTCQLRIYAAFSDSIKCGSIRLELTNTPENRKRTASTNLPKPSVTGSRAPAGLPAKASRPHVPASLERTGRGQRVEHADSAHWRREGIASPGRCLPRRPAPVPNGVAGCEAIVTNRGCHGTERSGGVRSCSVHFRKPIGKMYSTTANPIPCCAETDVVP